jgi:hypothetical protein
MLEQTAGSPLYRTPRAGVQTADIDCLGIEVGIQAGQPRADLMGLENGLRLERVRPALAAPTASASDRMVRCVSTAGGSEHAVSQHLKTPVVVIDALSARAGEIEQAVHPMLGKTGCATPRPCAQTTRPPPRGSPSAAHCDGERTIRSSAARSSLLNSISTATKGVIVSGLDGNVEHGFDNHAGTSLI